MKTQAKTIYDFSRNDGVKKKLQLICPYSGVRLSVRNNRQNFRFHQIAIEFEETEWDLTNNCLWNYMNKNWEHPVVFQRMQ